MSGWVCNNEFDHVELQNFKNGDFESNESSLSKFENSEFEGDEFENDYSALVFLLQQNLT